MKYPDKYSEFELQAILYNELKNRNIDVKGEVTWKHKEEYCRLDLVVYITQTEPILAKNKSSHILKNKKKPICIIEVKSCLNRVTRTKFQIQWYESTFNLPVLLFNNIIQLDYVISEILKSIDGNYNKQDYYKNLKQHKLNTGPEAIQEACSDLIKEYPILLEY